MANVSSFLEKSDAQTESMGALSPARGGIGGMSGSEYFNSIMGITGAEASAEAARIQAEAAEEARQLVRKDLAPFRRLGKKGMRGYESLLGQEDQINFLENNPFLQSLLSMSSVDNPMVGGIEGTDEALRNAYFAKGNDLINQQLNRYLPLINIGGSSAARTAAQGTDLLTSAATARSAGLMGAAGAEAQGMANLAQLGGALGGYFSGRSNAPVVSSTTAQPMQQPMTQAYQSFNSGGYA